MESRYPRRLRIVSLLVALALMVPLLGTTAEDGTDGVDPFGDPEGPIPFPILNVSSSYDEDRFPTVYADEDSMRVIWNKGARDMFVYHVVHREYDGTALQEGEDWVSVEDPTDQDFVAHEHYSHEGMAVGFQDKIYFVWASDDQNYTSGTEHDIALRTLDPDTGEWGPIVEVTPNDGGQDREPQAAVLDGRLVIAWRTNDDGKADGTDDDIVLRTYDGAAFSEIVEVTPDGDGAMDARLDMAVVGDRLVVVWEWNNQAVRPSDWEVMYREWDGSGFTSDPVAIAPDPQRVSKLPRVAQVQGMPFVVWENRPRTGGPGAVGILGMVMDGPVPHMLVNVTRPGSGAENLQPDVVATGDLAYVLWSSFDDALTHGSDSDIVMRSFDGEELGPVVEVSHPRDPPSYNEGFVVGCVFEDNLYAVWRMFYYIDPPIPVGINEDIVLRRVTDHRVDLTINQSAEDEDPKEAVLVLSPRTFYGAPLAPDGLGLAVHVQRDLEVLGTVQLTDPGDGTLMGAFPVSEPGTYTFTVTMEGRVVVVGEITVTRSDPVDEDSGPFAYITIGALVLLLLAAMFYLRTRK
jgi:hypothetical protein